MQREAQSCEWWSSKESMGLQGDTAVPPHGAFPRQQTSGARVWAQHVQHTKLSSSSLSPQWVCGLWPAAPNLPLPSLPPPAVGQDLLTPRRSPKPRSWPRAASGAMRLTLLLIESWEGTLWR